MKICLSFFLTIATTGIAIETRHIILRIGEQKLFSGVAITRIASVDSKTLDAKLVKDQLILTGKKEGKTNFFAFQNEHPVINFQITVSNKLPSKKTPSTNKILVSIEVKIVELITTKLNDRGIKWPGGISARVALPNKLFISELINSVEDTNTLGIKLNMLVKDNLASIIANPRLVTNTDEEAKFISGGEFPIKIKRIKHSEVVWKQYGVILNIKPHIDDQSQLVTLSLVAEVSNVDEHFKVEDSPALQTRRIESRVGIMPGKSLIISGLVKNEERNETEAFPVLSQIPIIGKLFETIHHSQSSTELSFMVTPTLLGQDI